jgi:hypothetical protein
MRITFNAEDLSAWCLVSCALMQRSDPPPTGVAISVSRDGSIHRAYVFGRLFPEQVQAPCV